jgi:hypothetical protein
MTHEYLYMRGQSPYPPVSVPLEWGTAFLVIPKPAVGKHSVVVQFAAQGNYASAAATTESFVVTAAP